MLSFFVSVLVCIFSGLSPNNCLGDEPTPSDAAVLANSLTETVDSILEASQGLPMAKSMIYIETGPGITLNSMAKDSIAALLTERECTITESSTDVSKIRVTITDARVVMKKNRKKLFANCFT